MRHLRIPQGSVHAFARIFLLFHFLLYFQTSKVYPQTIPAFAAGGFEEAPTALLRVELGEESGEGDGKPEATLFMAGSWKGSVLGAASVSLSEWGLQALSNSAPILFTQEIDLSLRVVVLERWFVEASFLDDYALNTYRAGYSGTEGETIRYAGLGNVGLDFPAFPYIDISGGTPSSFGAYAAFGSGPLGLHALLRYDSVAGEEKTYVNGQERTIVDMDPAKRLRGQSFVLPDTGLASAPRIFLEDPAGTFQAADGRKYRVPNSAEASYSALYGLVELKTTPKGRVMVSYSVSGNPRADPWADSLGEYSDSSGGAGTGFLGITQAAFLVSSPRTELPLFPQPGDGTGKPATVVIDGSPALALYEPGTFSPFERSNRYAQPSSATTTGEAELVRSSNGLSVPGFILFRANSSEPSGMNPGDTTQLTDGNTASTYYTLAMDSSPGGDLDRSPESRFPLAGLEPSIYYPVRAGRSTDLALRFTSYGAPGSYSIGTDVVAGSIIVTRGGIRDPLASFDAETGVVSLSGNAVPGEIVRISYLKNAQDRRFGSLAAGIGAIYGKDEQFSARAALALRWNLSGSAFTSPDESNPGKVSLSAGAQWINGKNKLDLAASLHYENPDTTGMYRAAGMEDAELKISLGEDDAYEVGPPLSPHISNEAALFEPFWTGIDARAGMERVPDSNNTSMLVYRNYRNSDVLGNSILMELSWNGATLEEDKEGPYSVSAPELNTTALVAEYELGDGKAENGTFALWTGFQATLGNEASALSRARKLVVPYRFYDVASGSAQVLAYLQLGSLSSPDDGFAESAELVWSAPITASAVSSSDTEWRYATLDLGDEDRRRLGEVRAVRFVVRLEKAASEPAASIQASGRLLVAPLVVHGSDFRPVVLETSGLFREAADNEVKTASMPDTVIDSVDGTVLPTLSSRFSSEIKRLHPNGESQRILRLEWTDTIAGSANDAAAGSDGFPAPMPLDKYGSLSFFIRGPTLIGAGDLDGAAFRLVIAASPAAIGDPVAGGLDVRIPLSNLTPGSWSQVRIDYRGEKTAAFVDGTPIPEASIVYRSSQDTMAWLGLLVYPGTGKSLPAAHLAVDELVLENPASNYGAKLGSSFTWKWEGPWLTMLGIPLVSNIQASATMELGASGNGIIPDESSVNGGSNGLGEALSARSRGSISMNITGMDLKINAGDSTSTSSAAWDASHTVSIPLGPILITDQFNQDPASRVSNHELILALSKPVVTRFSAVAKNSGSVTDQTWKADIGFTVQPNNLDQPAPPAKELQEGQEVPQDEDVQGDQIEPSTPATFVQSAPALYFTSSFTGGYTTDVDSASIKTWERDYFSAWAEGKKELLPDSGGAARKREFSASGNLGIRPAPMGIDLLGTAGEAFNATKEERTGRLGLMASIPLRFRDWGMTISLSRSGSSSVNTPNTGDSLDDADEFSRYLGTNTEMWSFLPVQTLVSDQLATSFTQASKNMNAARFRDGVGLDLTLPPVRGLLSFFIPGSLNASLFRVLERKLDTQEDTVEAGMGLDYSAINYFGAFGTYPYFRFYKSDEYETAFGLKITSGSLSAWEASLRQGASFYGFTDSQLSVANTIRIGSSGWSEGALVAWTTPSPNSLLATIYRSLIVKAANWKAGPYLSELASAELSLDPVDPSASAREEFIGKEAAIAERRENLEFSVSDTTTAAWNLAVTHESLVRSPGKINLRAFASLGLSGSSKTNPLQPILFTISCGISLALIF